MYVQKEGITGKGFIVLLDVEVSCSGCVKCLHMFNCWDFEELIVQPLLQSAVLDQVSDIIHRRGTG